MIKNDVYVNPCIRAPVNQLFRDYVMGYRGAGYYIYIVCIYVYMEQRISHDSEAPVIPCTR